jgi:hypothetical protein
VTPTLYLKRGTQPVSETSCFLVTLDSGLWTRSTNPVSLSDIQRRENPLDSKWNSCFIFRKSRSKNPGPVTSYHYWRSTWPESASELHRPRDRCLSTKLMPTLADRGCHVVNVTDPYGCNLGFLDRRRYCFFQVAPQLCSRGWVDPVPDPLLLRKSGSAGNRTRDFWICS